MDVHLQEGKGLGDLNIDKVSWEDFRSHLRVCSLCCAKPPNYRRERERERERETGMGRDRHHSHRILEFQPGGFESCSRTTHNKIRDNSKLCVCVCVFVSVSVSVSVSVCVCLCVCHWL